MLRVNKKIGYDTISQKVREALGYSTGIVLRITNCLFKLLAVDKYYMWFGTKVFQYYVKLLYLVLPY